MFLDHRVLRLAGRLQSPCITAVLIAAAGLLAPATGSSDVSVGIAFHTGIAF